MKRPRTRELARSRELAALSPADELRVEALTVAMALAPGVYARNRMFDLFANAAVQRAKSRAATLRGLVKHLVRASSLTLTTPTSTPASEAGAADYVLRYEIPSLALIRTAELSRVELATLRALASRSGVAALPLDDGDRALIESALARLLLAGGDTSDLAAAARAMQAQASQDVATTPSWPPPPGE